jgi:hypothetical protein
LRSAWRSVLPAMSTTAANSTRRTGLAPVLARGEPVPATVVVVAVPPAGTVVAVRVGAVVVGATAPVVEVVAGTADVVDGGVVVVVGGRTVDDVVVTGVVVVDDVLAPETVKGLMAAASVRGVGGLVSCWEFGGLKLDPMAQNSRIS